MDLFPVKISVEPDSKSAQLKMQIKRKLEMAI